MKPTQYTKANDLMMLNYRKTTDPLGMARDGRKVYVIVRNRTEVSLATRRLWGQCTNDILVQTGSDRFFFKDGGAIIVIHPYTNDVPENKADGDGWYCIYRS